MNDPYCPKHEWSAGTGVRCPDCVELDALQAKIDGLRGEVKRYQERLNEESKRAAEALTALQSARDIIHDYLTHAEQDGNREELDIIDERLGAAKPKRNPKMNMYDDLQKDWFGRFK